MHSEEHPWATVGRGKGGDYTWFDPTRAIGRAWGRYLPHWRQPGAIYFLTFRTADSIPIDVLMTWRKERDAWLAEHPKPHNAETERKFHERFTEPMHRFLDEAHGECPFRNSGAREIMSSIFHQGDGADYALDAFVVMPNHVHVLVAPRGATRLSTVVRTWKSVSAHRINQRFDRSGGLWQLESWDHLVRSQDHLERYRRYIENNPRRLPR